MYKPLTDEKWEKLIRRITSEDEAKRIHAALRLARSAADAERTRNALLPLVNDERVASLVSYVLERLPARHAA
ncbi:MAG: hypothetical protein EBV06_16455 [Planctomycetia bacterium]|nr:hypothetical protein [Planctomycetia bacterium]